MSIKSVTIANLHKGDKVLSAIEALGNKAASLQMEMHRVACSVLLHVGENKDVRVIYRLLAAMPDMARTNGLRAWLCAFAPISIVTKDDGTDLVLFDKERAKGIGNGVKLGDAIKKPFWKFAAREGVAYKPLDLSDTLDGWIKRLEKDAKETKRDHSAIINALKVQKVTPGLDAIGVPVVAPAEQIVLDPLAA